MAITGIVFLILCSLFILTIVSIIIKGNDSKEWLKSQWEWAKGFFEEKDNNPNKPSHKNLIAIALITIFMISYMRVLVATEAQILPDIPSGWKEIILGVLLIRSAQSVLESRKNSDETKNRTI